LTFHIRLTISLAIVIPSINNLSMSGRAATGFRFPASLGARSIARFIPVITLSHKPRRSGRLRPAAASSFLNRPRALNPQKRADDLSLPF
jgi:hypothetical protein